MTGYHPKIQAPFGEHVSAFLRQGEVTITFCNVFSLQGTWVISTQRQASLYSFASVVLKLPLYQQREASFRKLRRTTP